MSTANAYLTVRGINVDAVYEDMHRQRGAGAADRPRSWQRGQPAALRQQLRRRARASTGPKTLPVGENLILAALFDNDGGDPPSVSIGILFLCHGDKKVHEGRVKTQPGMSAADEGLCVGRDNGEPVTDDYPGTHPRWQLLEVGRPAIYGCCKASRNACCPCGSIPRPLLK
jgi:hypothetical protein